MRLLAMKIFWMVLLAALFLLPSGVVAQQQTPPTPPTTVKPEHPPEAPDLADLVLQANELSSRRAAIETKIAHGLDLKALKKGLQEIKASLAKYPPIIEQMQASPSLHFDKIAAYKDTIRLNHADLEKIIEPLTRAIKNLAEERKQWLAERKRWEKWQSLLLADENLDGIKNTFADTQSTIDSALLLINQQLQPLLDLLQQAGSVDGTINRLTAELDGLTLARRRALLVDESVPLFSWTYLSQLKKLTWFEVDRGVET
ncbi:MAG: hypothetical protein P8X58_05650, partial [Syntrophobacterales bacterium]